MLVSGVIISDLDFKSLEESDCPKLIIDKEYMEIENYDDLCEWQNNKVIELEKYSKEYMLGQDDGQLFIFSNKNEVITKICSLFPTFEKVEVESDNYPYDYDYRYL